jgi:hypothetical protein
MLFVAVVGQAAGLASAGADPPALPPYGGDMTFPSIKAPSDPEEYSWEVILGSRLSLEQVDSQSIRVLHPDGTVASVIEAEQAHDAMGSTVPTSLAVSDGNVITLTVHHRAGNPAAGGVPFVYPVVGGAGFELGFEHVETWSPPEESSVKEQTTAAPQGCLVPSLRNKTLKQARHALGEADCKLGDVRRREGADKSVRGKIVGQSPKASAIRPQGAAVAVTLAVARQAPRKPGTGGY